MIYIAVTNQKGGVAKTTTTINLGAAIANVGKKVLLVDLDPQHNLTVSLGIDPQKLDYMVYDLLKNEANLSKTIIKRNNIDLIPSSLKLSASDLELNSIAGREFLLKEALSGLDGYDYVLMDCPPSLGILTLNALTAADEVFIPVQTEYLALQGINMLVETIEVVNKRLNPKLRVTGVIATRFDARKKLNNEVVEYLEEIFKDILFKTFIRDNVSIAESTSFGQTIFEYKANSNGAEDYLNLAKEFLSKKKD